MKKLESENSLVVRANQLIEAKYRLTATEQKIIYMLTAMIEKNDEDFKPYNLMIIDLMALIDTDSKSKYTEVKTASRNMMKKVFTIHDTIKGEEIQVAWFSSVNYKHKKGIVEFEFSPYLKPLMLQVKSSFTKFNLDNVMQLRSGYSLRLYELFKQYEKIGKRQFKLAEFRELIGIPENEYSRYPDLKVKVILQAHKEINARTDIMFEFEEIKEGRKVTALKFNIQSKKEVIIIEPEPQKQPSTDIETIKAEFRRLYKGELVDLFVQQMVEAKGITHVWECLRAYKDYIKSQNIRNIGGHFKTFVMDGYEKPVAHQGNIPQRDNFKQREYTEEELEGFYTKLNYEVADNLAPDPVAEKKTKPPYTQIKEHIDKLKNTIKTT